MSIQRFLQAALRSAGVKPPTVYLDSTDIRGGDLPTELGRGLAGAGALIVCCSPAAAASRWVELEIREYAKLRADGLVIPLLLAGTPDGALPRALDASLRVHDVRSRVWLGVVPLHVRDELLRVVALVSGKSLRDLINWDRRRLITRTAVAGIAAVPPVTGAWWLYDRATRLTAADVRAEVTLDGSYGEDQGAQAAVNDVLASGPELVLVGSTRAADGARGWPQRFDARHAGRIRTPEVVLSGLQTRSVRTETASVDGTTYMSVRSFDTLSGELGVFDRRDTWRGARFEAIFRAVHRDMQLVQAARGDAEIQRAFDELYGITAEDRNGWTDYSVIALPIRAQLVVYLDNVRIWTARGQAARLWEWDEDVRGVNAIYFPPGPAQGTRPVRSSTFPPRSTVI